MFGLLPSCPVSCLRAGGLHSYSRNAGVHQNLGAGSLDMNRGSFALCDEEAAVFWQLLLDVGGR